MKGHLLEEAWEKLRNQTGTDNIAGPSSCKSAGAAQAFRFLTGVGQAGDPLTWTVLGSLDAVSFFDLHSQSSAAGIPLGRSVETSWYYARPTVRVGAHSGARRWQTRTGSVVPQ